MHEPSWKVTVIPWVLSTLVWPCDVRPCCVSLFDLGLWIGAGWLDGWVLVWSGVVWCGVVWCWCGVVWWWWRGGGAVEGGGGLWPCTCTCPLFPFFPTLPPSPPLSPFFSPLSHYSPSPLLWSWTTLSRSANDKRNRARVVLAPFSNLFTGRIKWLISGESPVQVLTRFLFTLIFKFFFSVSFPLPSSSSSLTPPSSSREHHTTTPHHTTPHHKTTPTQHPRRPRPRPHHIHTHQRTQPTSTHNTMVTERQRMRVEAAVPVVEHIQYYNRNFWNTYFGNSLHSKSWEQLSKDENSVPMDDFPRPLKYIDVNRQTKTSIDVLHEATIDDYWNFDGDNSLSEPWIGVTRFVPAQPKYTRRRCVGSRQTDEARGHNMTRTSLANKKLSA